MANYIKRLVTCFDCDRKYYEMVLNGEIHKFVFKCGNCVPGSVPLFWRIRKA